MPRRREVPKREVLPDPKFGNQDLSKFVNVLMTAGKKSVAERILYGALEQVSKKSGKDPIEVFNMALNNANHQPISAQAPDHGNRQEQGACACRQPAEARRLHPCLYHDSEEAELCAA